MTRELFHVEVEPYETTVFNCQESKMVKMTVDGYDIRFFTKGMELPIGASQIANNLWVCIGPSYVQLRTQDGLT